MTESERSSAATLCMRYARVNYVVNRSSYLLLKQS